jgi:hypothetical protein
LREHGINPLGSVQKSTEFDELCEFAVTGKKIMEDRIKKLENRIKTLEEKTKPLKTNWLYIVIFGITAVFTFLLVAHGWAEKPTVTIDFNVGEIIGGLLVGIASVFAALSYARRRPPG